jgi:hypothetical protein
MTINHFQGKTAVIATMHKKEEVIAPLLKRLGIDLTVIPEFDTDRFGTFTRDCPRPDNQLETAKLKARSALDLCDHTLAVASEGSFFPHPLLPMLPYNREIIVLYNREQEYYIWAESLSTDTNYSQAQVKNWDEALQFAQKVGFPSHGLVTITDRIMKGIVDINLLEEIINYELKYRPIVHLETDMRAMYNPTRMKNIAQATENLIQKLQSLCPNCSSPGFEIISRKPGLPCSWCGMPTQEIQTIIYGCQFCNFKQEIVVESKTADPQFCQFCNP